MFSIRSASRVYRMGEVDVRALREAELEIPEGDFLVIVGPSGSGKTTLLNLLGGMDRPTSGEVLFRGRDLARCSDRQLTEFRRNEVGFVFQFYNLVPTLTARENVEVAAEIARDPMDCDEALALVGLADRADHFPAQLSGGEQQRVAIARALAKNPSVLLCDEPTGALDLETSRQVMRLLLDLNRDLGKTLLLITHNGALARAGRRVAHMRDGAITSVGANEHPVPVEEIAW